MEVVLDITWDIEANNLLNNTTIDYTASPYCLKPTFAVHCIVVEEHQTGKLIAFYDGDTYELDGRVYAEQIEGQVYKLEDYLPITYTHKQLHKHTYIHTYLHISWTLLAVWLFIPDG